MAPTGLQARPRARFEALYHADRLHVVNPAGDVGLLTLWTPVRAVARKLGEASPELLDPARSRIAVVANLYGDGMYAMFCNLLYNPQIRHLVAVGQDLGLPLRRELEAFLDAGLEPATVLGRRLARVRGTDRMFPELPEFDAERLRDTVDFSYLGKLSRRGLVDDLAGLLRELPDARTSDPPERVRVEMPAFDGSEHAYRPSDPGAHQVVRRRPLDCWEELVVRLMRFGRPVTAGGGPRLELLNVKTVITCPGEDPAHALADFGFEPARLRAYQREILEPELPEGISYTYGNRLRRHFRRPDGSTDALDGAIAALRADPDTRRAYVSLWDGAADTAGAEAVPCLTTLFFRRAQGRLTLTATYRAHNLLSAWLANAYGLIAVQRHVAAAVGMETGAITVVSHSLTIDPRSPRFEAAAAIAERWRRDDDVDRETGKASLREDPNGYFVVSVDRARATIVAEHRYRGVLVKRYEAERAVTIEHEVSADMAVTLVSHALWLGRELARKEQELRTAVAG